MNSGPNNLFSVMSKKQRNTPKSGFTSFPRWIEDPSEKDIRNFWVAVGERAPKADEVQVCDIFQAYEQVRP